MYLVKEPCIMRRSIVSCEGPLSPHSTATELHQLSSHPPIKDRLPTQPPQKINTRTRPPCVQQPLSCTSYSNATTKKLVPPHSFSRSPRFKRSFVECTRALHNVSSLLYLDLVKHIRVLWGAVALYLLLPTTTYHS